MLYVFLQYNVLFFTVDSILLPFFSAVQCLFTVQRRSLHQILHRKFYLSHTQHFQGRIEDSPLEGALTLGRGRVKYDFAEFSTKELHEIKKILGRRGARAGGAPLDPPLILNIKDPSNNLPVQQNTCGSTKFSALSSQLHCLKIRKNFNLDSCCKGVITFQTWNSLNPYFHTRYGKK